MTPEEAIEILKDRASATLAEVSTDWDLVAAVDLAVFALTELGEEVTPDDYKVLSDRLRDEAVEMEERIVLGTADQWAALECIKDASRFLFSAYALLTRPVEAER